ncbi:MAG: WD40 repeat domain-containing protein [Verrucomicrobiales bacterium]
MQEAERWEYARAKLWNDAAAELAAGDPERAEASRLRARSFGALAARPLRAAMMEVQVWSFHEAHPSLPYFITHGRAEKARWVFDADRCRFVGKSDGFLGSFSALAFDPLKPAFAASPSDGRIEWRGLPEGEILDSIDLSGGGIGAIDQLAVSPDGALVFIASGDGYIYDLETKSLWPARLADCGDLVRARFRGDGAFLVMAGRFGGSGTRLFRIDAENRAATEVPLEDVADQPPRTSGEELPEFVGDQYLLNHSGGFVFYHEVESGRCGGYIKGVIPAPGKWRQWIGPTAWPQPLKRALRETPEHRYDLTASELRMPGGQSAITRLTKEVTNLEDGFRSALPHFIGMPVGFLNGGGSRGALAVTREDHLFRLWCLPPEGRLWTVPCAGKSAPVFSADGRFAAAAGKAQREIRVFDLAARAEAGTAFTLPESDVARCADFSPDDGAVIAIGIHELIENDNDRDEMPVPGRVEFWDWRSGERLGDPVALPAQPLALRYHPGGGWVAVACQGGQVYRLARGVGDPELLFNADPALPLDSLTFTEGGAALIAARSGSSGSSQTYVWDVGAGGFRFSPFPVGVTASRSSSM